jgi:hypothetical protein
MLSAQVSTTTQRLAMSAPISPPTPQRFPSNYSLDPTFSVSIPLHIVPLTINPAPPISPAAPAAAATSKKDGATAGYKIGIKLTVSTPQGSAPEQMYEFDTGGQGFWVLPTGSLPVPHVADCPLQITYTSGLNYKAAPTLATIVFSESASPQLAVNAVVGLIGEAGGPQVFPIFNQFWGDFGCALQGFANSTAGALSKPSLLTALAQLPPPYNSGFIVDVGPYPGTNATNIPPGQLIVGLTPELRGLFPNTMSMAPSTPYLSAASATPIGTFQENAVNGTLQVAGNTASNIGVVFDTGAPGTMLHPGSAVTFQAGPGDPLVLAPEPPAPYSLLNYLVGLDTGANSAQNSSQNLLQISTGYINTGLTSFFQSQIMFDLEKGVIGFPTT